MADLQYWASGNQWNNSACSLRTPGTPSPKRGAQSHAPDPLLDGRHGPQVTEERTKEYSERRCGLSKVPELVGARAGLLIPTTLVVPRTEERGHGSCLCAGRFRKGGRLCWHSSWQHPKNQPALPQLLGPLYSLAPLVTPSLAALSISQAVRTLGAPPCLSPLKGQGVGSPRLDTHEPRGLWRNDFPGKPTYSCEL